MPQKSKSNDSIVPTPLPKYKQVQIRVLTSKMDTLPAITLKPNQKVALPSEGVSVMATDFYNDWKIKQKPINASNEERNPAVKLQIFQGDSLLYESWAFKNIPFFGVNQQMGHASKGSNRMYFTLLKYEGLEWTPEKK